MQTPNNGNAHPSLSNSMEIVVGTFHPDLRTKMVLLGNTLTCLILKSGSRQHEWLSVYEVFSRLSTSLNSHMLRESTLFFPGLGIPSAEAWMEPLPGGSIPMGQQMEAEHRDILDQCKALGKTVNLCYDGQAYVDLMEEARLELAELEAAIRDYEDFESQLISRLSKNTGSKEGEK